jgi:hypothetical protein
MAGRGLVLVVSISRIVLVRRRWISLMAFACGLSSEDIGMASALL